MRVCDVVGWNRLKFLEARFDLKNNIGFFPVLEILRQRFVREPRRSPDQTVA